MPRAAEKFEKMVLVRTKFLQNGQPPPQARGWGGGETMPVIYIVRKGGVFLKIFKF